MKSRNVSHVYSDDYLTKKKQKVSKYDRLLMKFERAEAELREAISYCDKSGINDEYHEIFDLTYKAFTKLMNAKKLLKELKQ